MYGVYQLLMLRGSEQLSTHAGRAMSGYALTQLGSNFNLEFRSNTTNVPAVHRIYVH
jgi:hypothetical protein